MTETHADEARDFDFLHGDWRVKHRKLASRLTGDETWLAFNGTTRVHPILQGTGNFDENRLEAPEGVYQACTLRLYDPQARCWNIHWIDGRWNRLDPPLSGRFEDGKGVFLGEDVFEGRPIRVRFLWTPIAPDHARWEQAFSDDGGQTWEANWVMDFHRA